MEFVKNTMTHWIGVIIGVMASASLYCEASTSGIGSRTSSIDLPRGESIIAPGLDSFKLKSESPGLGRMSVVPVNDMPFKEAVRVETLKRPRKNYNLQLLTPGTAAVKIGDVMLLQFYGRCLSADGDIVAQMEKASSPWNKLLNCQVSLSRQWKKYSIPFSFKPQWNRKKDFVFAANETQVSFNLGFNPQIVEIADVRCEKFSPGIRCEDLPNSIVEYPGMEDNAPWRRDALQRIEQIRKADFQLRVVDSAGNPVSGALLQIEMKRHAFPFGVAVNEYVFARTTSDALRYKDEIGKLFNFAVLETHLKWSYWEKADRREVVKQMLSWFDANRIPVRGHTLVWPSWSDVPASLKKLENDPPALRKAIAAHVRDEASALQGRVVHWDVLNEVVEKHAVSDICGKEAMVEWFKIAHASDPRAKLYINDYNILAKCESHGLTDHQQQYLTVIRGLIAGGAPLSGIGMQGHLGMQPTPPGKMLEIFDLYGKFGKELAITEYDNEFISPELSGKFTRDLLIAAFSHSAVTAFMFWGFWDGAHWLNNSPIYHKDWTLKPGGKAYIDLVFKEWWTNLQGKTNADGKFFGRGFLGEYEVIAKKDGKTIKRTFNLGKSASVLEIKLH